MNFIKHKYHRVVAFMLAICMFVLSVPSQPVYASSSSSASESDGIYTSMYDVSTALTAYANNVVGSNTNDKHDDHKLKEMDEKKPGIAGAYVGYGDSDKGFYGYISSNTAKAVTSSSYDAWLNVGDNGSTYAYARYGHLLSDLGLDETGDATGSSMARSTFGLFMQTTHSVAGFVPTIFEFSLKILRTLNPFRFLIDDGTNEYKESDYVGNASSIISGDNSTSKNDGKMDGGGDAVNDAITDNATGDNATAVTSSSNVLKPVTQVMTTIYSGTRTIGFLAIIPLLFVLLLWSMLMKRDMSGLKSFVIKFAFIVTGIPLCAALYTGVLDQTLTAVQTNPAASRLVACTFVDFQSWVQSSRLDLPLGVSLKSVGKSNSSGDSTTAAGAASAETLRSLRDITFRINNAVYQFNGLSSSGIGTGNTNQKESANFNLGMWDNNGNLKDNGSDSTIEKQINGLLQRYRSGEFYQASAWETSVNGALNKYHASELGATPSTSNANTNDGKIYQMYDETDESTDWMNRTVADNKKIFNGTQWSNFNIFSNGVLKSDSTSSTKVDSTITYSRGLRSSNWTGDMADPAVKGGLSSISMYNYLSSSFDDASISVYSAQKSTSEYTKKAHYSVNLIGSGALRVAYALNCVACLFSFALIGVMYGLGMVISNLKRGISMLMQIPFAMMGAVRGIVQVVMYVFAMCIELLFTVYVYQFVCEFIVMFASVIETPISNLVGQVDGMKETVIFGGRFSFLADFVSPETLYNNRYLFVFGIFGLMVAVVFFTGHVLVKNRTYLSAYEYAVCKYYRMITCKEMLPVFDNWMAERKSLYVWDGVSEINGLVSETVHDLSRNESNLEKGACSI